MNYGTVGRELLSSQKIEEMVRRIAADITTELAGEVPIFIGVLKGCTYFFTDLTRHIDGNIEVDFIQVSSYGMSTETSGSVVMVKDITIDVRDRLVYLVEDIVDTGSTLADLVELIKARHPRSLKLVSLLSKPSRRKVEIEADHLGCDIEDLFVIGYGLDYAERYRNLPAIHVLEGL